MKRRILLVSFFAVVGFFAKTNAQNTSVYVSDGGNFNNPPWQILKFDENGENGQVFISDHLAWPQDILFLEDDNTVLISNLNTLRISRFNATTGSFINEFATNIAGPTRMEIGPDSLLYVLQAGGNAKVKRYQLDGTFVDDFTAVGVSNSIGIDWDSTGNLYISSYDGKYVRKFSPTGADLGIFINSNLAGPTNIWFGDNGDLFVMDFNGNAVKRFDSDGNYLGVFISNLPQCEGFEFLPNGNLLLGVGGTSSVRVYSPSGTFVKDLVPSGTLGLLKPNAVVLRTENISSTKAVFKDLNFVMPSTGVLFQISKPDELTTAKTVEIFDAAGALVSTLSFSENTFWDASGQSAGMYLIVARLPDGKVAKQKVVVPR